MVKKKRIKIVYNYFFKTRNGLKVSFKSNNPQYAKQQLALRHNIKQKDLRLIKREKIK
jgi:hypothetical protein